MEKPKSFLKQSIPLWIALLALLITVMCACFIGVILDRSTQSEKSKIVSEVLNLTDTPGPDLTFTPITVLTFTPISTYTPTFSITPSNTSTPSNTPTITPTPTNTYTPTISPTPSNTSTPSNTPTITPTPTKTSTPTRTLVPSRTPTPSRTPDPRSLYSSIDIRELDAYTNNHLNEKVKLEGVVFNTGTDFFQIWVRKPGGYSWDTIPVYITHYAIQRPPGIYEDTAVIIYGVVMGKMEGTNAYGGTISQIWVDADIIEKK